MEREGRERAPDDQGGTGVLAATNLTPATVGSARPSTAEWPADCRCCPDVANDWNKRMVDEFHAKGGKGIGHFGDHLLLLTTTGAKTGRTLTTPLAYHRDGDRYVIAASKGGAPMNPGWYHNLVAKPEATVEVGAEKFKVHAKPLAKGPERDRLYTEHARQMPELGFAGYPQKTKRVIPVVVLERV